MASFLAEFVTDPEAVLDYEIDWSTYLGADTIATATWDVPDGITNEADTNTTTTTTIRVSGGVAGTSYMLKCAVELATGQEDVRRIKIVVQEL
jgi:hypothetical protein